VRPAAATNATHRANPLPDSATTSWTAAVAGKSAVHADAPPVDRSRTAVAAAATPNAMPIALPIVSTCPPCRVSHATPPSDGGERVTTLG
jgi:hypothetical protein